jgi:hypothetical protein
VHRLVRYSPVILTLLALLIRAPAARAEMPEWLPRYDLDVKIDVQEHQVTVKERVRWTNHSNLPTNRIVFNAHAHYSVPDGEVGLLAKSLELLRLSPKDALDFNGPALDVGAVHLVDATQRPAQALQYGYAKENATALEVALPVAVGPGESVTVEVDFILRLPQLQGRWGQWKGVTFLAQWLPVVAFFDDAGWQPAPFVPWHQPFFNEAGHYNVKVTLPVEQKLVSSSAIQSTRETPDGWKIVELIPICSRDYALFCSADYKEYLDKAGDVTIRVVAQPGHEWYAQEMVRIARDAIVTYGQWFGRYPYPQFTVVDTYFGWNGNECGGLVMIDSRIFDLPHLARNFVDSLLTHECCHQWWYNLVGTNGYAETWMDEGLATHFCHRLMDQRYGKNNELLTWPKGLGWLPNIHREDYRCYGMLGAMGRGDLMPVVQPMPEFKHLPNLMAMTYDRGGRIVGMIEEQLGHDGFLDFMMKLRCKYEYRILRVADYQRELEAYTGRSWEDFFQNWLYKTAMTDWCLESVRVEPVVSESGGGARTCVSFFSAFCGKDRPHHATIVVRQKGECSEPTTLGIRLGDGSAYQIRLPILPGSEAIDLPECSAHIVPAGNDCFVVEIDLPRRPTQIAVDPDRILLDKNPLNNTWKPEVNFRLTPIYTQLDETDITNAYDRWNIIVGPWVYGSSYSDPWYTKSEMVGLRAGVYRTQDFTAGGYLAYRTDDRNIVAGVDALWDHFPIPHMQIGFNFERSLTALGGADDMSRGALFARYVLMYSDSLYLPPFQYVEGYAAALSNPLPSPNTPIPNSDPFNQQSLLGAHYHDYKLTPYWDPVAGYALDVSYQQGFAIFGEHQYSEQLFGQFSFVKGMPAWMDWLRSAHGLEWLMDTRFAFRVHGAAALPDNGRIFAFGGGDLFRGYDQTARQGNLNWIASAEWRVPIWQDIEYPVLDHIATAKNLYGVLFYDTGNAYINNHETGPIAHAVGVGLRLDVSWFGLIERAMLRVDVAKTLNDASPWQVWLGIEHPF